jgi:hypothetical protein
VRAGKLNIACITYNDSFDKRVFVSLRISKFRDRTALMDEGGFNYDTLQQHLQRLTARSQIARKKRFIPIRFSQ